MTSVAAQNLLRPQLFPSAPSRCSPMATTPRRPSAAQRAQIASQPSGSHSFRPSPAARSVRTAHGRIPRHGFPIGNASNCACLGCSAPLRTRQVPMWWPLLSLRTRLPQWASSAIGALICTQCSGVHRMLGVEHSKVPLAVWTLICARQFRTFFCNAIQQSAASNTITRFFLRRRCCP